MKRRMIVLAAVMLGVLVGCYPEKRVDWSPDGRWAAVWGGDDGLYLCDADGKLSAKIADGVAALAWAPDSRRLVVVLKADQQRWAELKARITAEEAGQIEELGRQVLAELQAFKGDLDDFEPAALERVPQSYGGPLVVYLRDEHGEALKARLGEKWEELQDTEAELYELRVVNVGEGVPALGVPLVSSACGLSLPRVSPDGRNVLYGAEAAGKDPGGARLFVLPLEGGGDPRLVVKRAAWGPDWSVDGRQVYYAAPGPGVERDGPGIGTIDRRAVCDEGGRLLAEFPDAEELVGIAYVPETRVRCLRDGRVLFATFELQLPCTPEDMSGRASLFMIDPERQAVVTRLVPRQAEEKLPSLLHLFEPSPNGRHVCVPDNNGVVAILTLATGEVWPLHLDEEADELRTLPVWRSDDELTFSFGPHAEVPGGRAGIVLARLDWEQRTVSRKVLSGAWPDDVAGFLGGKSEETPTTQPAGE